MRQRRTFKNEARANLSKSDNYKHVYTKRDNSKIMVTWTTETEWIKFQQQNN